MERPTGSLEQITIIPSSRLFRFFSWLSFYLVLSLLNIVFPLLYSIRVRGRTNLDGIDAAITISNHCLYLDPAFAAYAFGRRRLFFTGLEETFTESKKPFELLIRLLGGFPIPRKSPWNIIDPVQKLISSRKQTLIHFFPEGNMTYKNQTIKSFRPGAFLVSQVVQVPVIPITVVFYPRKFWFPQLIIDILPPINPLPDSAVNGENNRNMVRDQARKARELMQNSINSLHAERKQEKR